MILVVEQYEVHARKEKNQDGHHILRREPLDCASVSSERNQETEQACRGAEGKLPRLGHCQAELSLSGKHGCGGKGTEVDEV